MKANNIENRSYISRTADVGDGRTVTGYACVFDSESENIGFYEIIRKGAITQEIIDKSDVFAKFNHDDDKVLARSRYGQGSLKLTLDGTGLKYEFEAPNTALGDELLEYLRRGDLNQSSFAFTVPKGGDKWTSKDGIMHREITQIDELFDISPVFTPAYSDTSCSCRSFDAIRIISTEIDKQMDAVIAEINRY